MQIYLCALYLQRIKLQSKEPVQELLELWEDQNHTVTELFVLLNRYMQLYCRPRWAYKIFPC